MTKAWISEVTGGPETLRLEAVTVAPPLPGEVTIAVRACGINFPDSLILRDQYQVRPPRPFAPGGEVAGVIAALGDGVNGWRPGDRVMARCGWGGLAEQVNVEATRCTAMPHAMPFDEAAAFLFTYTTAYYALTRRGRLAAGDALLVLGAAGGTGVAAVEIGKALGAHVVAAVSSEEKAAFARCCGADETLVYPRGTLGRDAARALTAQFKQATGTAGATIVFDPVGGALAEPALRAIAWGGRYLVVGFTGGIPQLPLNLPLLKGCDVVGVFNGHYQTHEADRAAEDRAALIRLYEAGRLRPRVTRRVPFAQAPDAIAAIAEGSVLGKMVVTLEAAA